MPAKLANMLVDGSLGDSQFATPEPIVLTELRRPSRTVEIEHRFAVRTKDMDCGLADGRLDRSRSAAAHVEVPSAKFILAQNLIA